jgi:hypothetical protein
MDGRKIGYADKWKDRKKQNKKKGKKGKRIYTSYRAGSLSIQFLCVWPLLGSPGHVRCASIPPHLVPLTVLMDRFTRGEVRLNVHAVRRCLQIHEINTMNPFLAEKCDLVCGVVRSNVWFISLAQCQGYTGCRLPLSISLKVMVCAGGKIASLQSRTLLDLRTIP